jgi:glycosyltransferase involved in cell wall biosynthesis
MLDASVIVCTHNPRPQYLKRVLDALKAQSLDNQRWELLLVDNASNPPLVGACDIAWHPKARLIVERELGVAAAKQRAMREASADLLVFVDDDNVLQADYLTNAVRIENEWPLLGVWGGGCIEAEFEIEPPAHFKEYLPALALREVTTPRWSNAGPTIDVTPWGAGQCLRAAVAQAYVRADAGSAIRITSRQGKALFGGEDVEICYVACELGLGIGIFPELKLLHLIPKERISEDYFLRMREFTGASNMVLEYKWRGAVPLDPHSLSGFLTVIKRVVMSRGGFHRRMELASARALLRARAIINESANSAAAPRQEPAPDPRSIRSSRCAGRLRKVRK